MSEPRTASGRGWAVTLVLLVATLGIFGLIRLLRAEQEPAPVPTLRDLRAADGLPVEVAPVRSEPVRRNLRIYGTTRGASQSEVVVPSPNVLARLHVAIGDEVRKGQLLASMRQVALSPLGYPYGPLEARVEALRADEERYRALYEQQAITEQQHDRFQAELRAAEADFAAAEAAVRITSPIDGTVTRIDFREGEMVPNDRPLLQVARIDRLVVDLMVEPVDVALVAEGQAVDLRSPASPDRELEGVVTEKALSAHPVLGQFRVRVEVDNPERALLPGFPVEARIRAGDDEPDLAVPARALCRYQDRDVVWVVDEDETARPVAVRVALVGDDLVAVEPLEPSSLATGEQVVTVGADSVEREGQRLRVIGP